MNTGTKKSIFIKSDQTQQVPNAIKNHHKGEVVVNSRNCICGFEYPTTSNFITKLSTPSLDISFLQFLLLFIFLSKKYHSHPQTNNQGRSNPFVFYQNNKNICCNHKKKYHYDSQHTSLKKIQHLNMKTQQIQPPQRLGRPKLQISQPTFLHEPSWQRMT